MGLKLQTSKKWIVTEFQAGKARGSHPGFSQAADNMPPETELWNTFFTTVLRGDVDGPWYDESGMTINTDSKTFSDASPTGQKPPTITATTVDGTTVGTAGAGAPDGGFVPTIASPGAVPGTVNVDYSSIPALNGEVVLKLQTLGAGLSTNGLVLSPHDGSDCQTSHDSAQTGLGPFYEMGMHAWSGEKAS